MKVIDLLNKIANGEVETNIEFFYKKEKYRHIDNLFADYYVEEVLNGEVEIIEEDKKVEKIDEELFEKASSSYRERIMKDKINEIIDYLEEKE